VLPIRAPSAPNQGIGHLAKSIASFKSACLWTPLFGLEVDFWTVFGHFWPFLEVAGLPFYEFIELFNF